MKLNFLCVIISLTLISNIGLAQDWRWEADPSFLNPQIDQESGETISFNGPCALADMNNDGTAEYIVTDSWIENGLLLFEAGGAFPEMNWTVREGFFESIQFPPIEWVTSFILHDLDGDNIPEILFYSVPQLMRDEPPEITAYQNEGDFENPHWMRTDDLLPEMLNQAGDEWGSIPCFCDWDDDGMEDLITCSEMGIRRYERNEEAGWDSLGIIGNISLPGREAHDFHLADFDGDGDLDILNTTDVMIYFDNFISFNTGSPEEPELSDPYSLNYDKFLDAFPFDINGDGHIDLVNGRRYMLNTGSDNPAEMWERAMYWGVDLRKHSSVLYDFDHDGEVELIQGFDHSIYDGYRWRLIQYRRTESGWQDEQFFDDDLPGISQEWPEYQKLAVINLYGAPVEFLVMAETHTNMAPQHQLALYTDMDGGEGYNWHYFPGLFDDVFDADLLYQIPSFADLDDDGNVDMVMLEGQQFDDLRVVFYALTVSDEEIFWTERADWAEGFDHGLRITGIEFGDFDNDGDFDLVTKGGEEAGDNQLIIWQNIGNRRSPGWSPVEDALADSGPERASVIRTADVNNDGRVDLVTQSMCYLNQTAGSVRDDVTIPVSFDVQVYPNPFNSTVKMCFSINQTQVVEISITDVSGRQVFQQLPERYITGEHQIVFSPGNRLPGMSSGVYYLNIRSDRIDKSLILNYIK